MIYLDHAANTPPEPAVLDVLCRTERAFPGNPNAAHPAGQAARAELLRVTDGIAGLLGVRSEELVYTAGATASNRLAIEDLARADRPRHVLSTPLEHPSVDRALDVLRRAGHTVELVDVGRDGRVELDHLRALLRADTALVCVCAVDGELGTVQPIRAIAALLRDRPGCRLHVDATQAVGRTALVLDGVDTMSLAPHKCGGLNGSGLLVRRRGGPAPSDLDGGTPALGLAAADELALRLALTRQEKRTARVRALNGRLRAALARYPAVRINSPADAVPHILNVSVRGVKGTVFQRALAACDVCVSVKSACATDGGPSRAVYAVVRDRRDALSSWRISLSHRTTDEEIAGFLERFDRCYEELVR